MFELITSPAVEPFTLTNLKEALRIDHSHEDDLVMQLGITARRFIERRLGRAVAEQTWRGTFPPPQQGKPLQLRPAPVLAIDDVEAQYGDAAFVQAGGAHRLLAAFPGTLRLDIPLTVGGEGLTAVRITFRSGLTDVSRTDEELLQAIFQLTAHYYEHREAVTEGRYVPMPLAVETLLAGLREVRL
jgi:uncharacterized phiE125 gp8 family phage protein